MSQTFEEAEQFNYLGSDYSRFTREIKAGIHCFSTFRNKELVTERSSDHVVSRRRLTLHTSEVALLRPLDHTGRPKAGKNCLVLFIKKNITTELCPKRGIVWREA